jgi:hypothetical protein
MPYFGVPLRNGVPLGLGSVAGFGGPADASTFSPAELFAANEPGVWYDPSDFSTLYQDVSGVTPVTALEQPVGLILDKSRGLATGNQLFTNSSFDSGSTGWSGLAFTASGGRATITNSSGSLAYVFQNVSATAGKVYEISADVVSVSGTVKITVNGGAGVVSAALSTGVTTVRLQNSFANGNAGLEIGIGATVVLDSLTIREVLGTPALQITSASRPVVSARYNLFINTAALATQNVTTAATSYTFRFEGSGSVVLSGTATGTYAAGSHTVVCTAGTLTATVTGQVLNADIRAVSDGVGLPVYQFVGAAVAGTSTTAGTPAYDTAGFPIYLSFDGSNDSL